MTVQELRNLLAAARQVSGLPWTLINGGYVLDSNQEPVAGYDGEINNPEVAAFLVTAVNTLPALLDVADAAQLHDCQTTAGYSANLRARDEQPCPICDALERLGETP